MFKNLMQKIVDFYFPICPDYRLDTVKLKCDDVMNRYDINTPEFEKALALRMEVDNFEVELAKNRPVKQKKPFKIDPAVIVAGIGAGAQVLCTLMVERFQSDGGIFKSGSTGWINSGGLFGKLMTPRPKKDEE